MKPPDKVLHEAPISQATNMPSEVFAVVPNLNSSTDMN